MAKEVVELVMWGRWWRWRRWRRWKNGGGVVGGGDNPPQEQLWQSWHGDSHLIADDKRRWKEQCPTFTMVLDRYLSLVKWWMVSGARVKSDK